MRPADQEEIEKQCRRSFADTCRTGALFVTALAYCVDAQAETRVTPTASVDTSYTDNVRGSAEGTEESDLLATPTVGVVLRNTSARTSVNLNYSLSADRYLDAQDLNEERHSLTGLGNAEIVRGYVDVDVQTSLSRQTTNREGPVSGIDRNLGANQTDTFIYGITPRYRTDISNWGVSDAAYNFSQTIFDPFGNLSAAEDTGQDATTHGIRYNLSSGRRFTRIGWSLASNYSRTSAEGGTTTSSWAGDATVSYEVNRMFRPRVSAGYDRFRGGRVNTSGPSWAIGTQFTPGPRTTVDIEYGRDFDDNHIQGNATFRITPTLSLTATAAHQFNLAQQQLSRGLQDLTVDEQGNFIDSSTGQPFTGTPVGSDLSEVNNVTRTQTYTLGMNGSRGRNTYGLLSSVREETNSLSGRKTTTLTSGARFGRALSPHLRANLSAQLSGTEDNSSNDIRSTNLSAGLSYRLGENVTGATNYTFTQTDSSGTGIDRMENTITARLQITF